MYVDRIKTSLHVMLFFAGLVLVAVGVYSIMEPWQSFGYFVKYTGITLFVSSFLLLVYSFFPTAIIWEKRIMIAESLVDLFFATILIFNPFLTVIVYPLIVGTWVFIRGLLKVLLSLLLSRQIAAWKYILIVGIISMAFGLVFILYPYSRFRGAGLRISIFAIVLGALYIYDAFRLRKSDEALFGVF